MMLLVPRFLLTLLLWISSTLYVVDARRRVRVDATTPTSATYTSRDDVSWAITSADKLASPYHQQLYNEYMDACNKESQGACQGGEDFRLRMNRDQPSGVYNYTQVGFQKLRVPEKLFKLVNDFWLANKGNETIEWKSINSYHNMWDAPPLFVSMEDVRNQGGGPDLQRAVWAEARKVLEEWTGMRLSPVSMYGVRVYQNNSILAPHVDRMPLVTSCIINLDQDVDEVWPLEVFDHDGYAHNVTMEPGDMVLYESHSVIHGRPFPFKGRAFVNVFLHFEPIGPLDDISKCGPTADGLPPYVIPGGAWEEEYVRSTGVWKVLDDVPSALIRGDVRALEYIAYNTPEKLHQVDYNGWRPIHEAVYRGDIDSVQFLLDNGASLDDRIEKKNMAVGPDVLSLAQQSPNFGYDHPIFQFLQDQREQSEL